MTTRWLPALFSSRPELRPARALLTPAWLIALGVLALNDHLLKGAGALPGAVTGKLSDVAGLVVAPALLAALLGVRSRRGLLMCCAAVGLVFSSINLSPACADAWSWLMGLIGFPWKITVDPTDLLTLPALALGWRALVPAMTHAPRARRAAPHPAEASAAVLGTLLCVATSDDGGGEPMMWVDPGGEGDWAPIDADAYLHNDSDETITIRLRELRSEVIVDCLNAFEDPGVYFTPAHFGEGVTWTLPPYTNAPARQLGGSQARECYAVLAESDTLHPTVLFWYASGLPVQTVPGATTDGAHAPGAVILTSDLDHRVSITGSERDIVFPTEQPGPDAVMPQPDRARLEWSEAPVGVHELSQIERGADGCLGVSFDGGAEARWYVCVPEDSFPFTAGEFVEVRPSATEVTLRLAAGPLDPEPVVERTLTISRGASLPALPDLALASTPDFDVELAPDPACGTVARPQSLTVHFSDQPIAELLAGQSTTLADGAHALTVHAVHLERRVIVDHECAEGPDAVGNDLEVVVLRQALEP